MAVEERRQATRTPAAAAERLGSTREVAKFAGGVALLGIFWDAAAGHALTWENDPYWTYWITKTFLIATVFGLGTAWLGVGVGRGAAITAAHTVVLTIYYWTLSPIGLPASPTWLDLEHTWITGLPVHFAVIYLGYLTTLWLWRRRGRVEAGSPQRDALIALLAAIGVVVVGGGVASVAVAEWPGVTYFLVRLLITFPFLMLWWSLAGRDWQANVAGAVLLAFLWATYGEYLGPIGLPDDPLRISEEAPPPADVHWLNYYEQWLVSLPIYMVAAAAILEAAACFLRRSDGAGRDSLPHLAAAGGIVALLVIPLVTAAFWIDGSGEEGELAASGSASIERGAWFSNRMQNIDARLTLFAEDRVRKISPLPPYDVLRVDASLTHPGGRTYRIAADQPLSAHPAGRYATWSGVGVDVWHHGQSGIGSDELPATRSELAVLGLAAVSTEGRTIARGVPIHVMTRDEPQGLELQVGDPATPVPGLPDGHLRVIWGDFSGGVDRDAHWPRYASGSMVLLLLLGFALAANRSVPRAARSI
jgi:hypothetical protein